VQQLTAEQFMRYIHEQDDVYMLLMGYDHCFGSDRVKGFSEYVKIANRVGVHVERAHECLVDGVPVSSSRIRKLLNEGQIEQVNRLLGYGYTLNGEVVRGNGIGNQIGYPTANVSFSPERKLPLSGVYAATVKCNEVDYPAVVNVGTNPTVGNSQISVEAHLIDFQSDIYGEVVSVSFDRFIRPEKKFTSLVTLQEQIDQDIRSL
jgi:riboflavin kinase/FMN adenylyltransferase